MITHPIEPTYDKDSKILILGSFPSVKSRDMGYFYGHPQNRFWKVLAYIWGESVPMQIKDRKEFLLKNHIALWDVIASCDIEGSSDSSIKNVRPNDISKILKCADIAEIYANGQKAGALYKKYMEPVVKRSCTILPSTSPANASWSMDRLIEAWSAAICYNSAARR